MLALSALRQFHRKRGLAWRHCYNPSVLLYYNIRKRQERVLDDNYYKIQIYVVPLSIFEAAPRFIRKQRSYEDLLVIEDCLWGVIERLVAHPLLHRVVELGFVERYKAAPAKVDARGPISARKQFQWTNNQALTSIYYAIALYHPAKHR